MSMLEGLASTLAEMSFVQLALVFLAVTVLAVAGFAGAAWALSAMLGLGVERGVVVAVEEEARAPFRLPVPQSLRALAASVIRSPL